MKEKTRWAESFFTGHLSAILHASYSKANPLKAPGLLCCSRRERGAEGGVMVVVVVVGGGVLSVQFHV